MRHFKNFPIGHLQVLDCDTCVQFQPQNQERDEMKEELRDRSLLSLVVDFSLLYVVEIEKYDKKYENRRRRS